MRCVLMVLMALLANIAYGAAFLYDMGTEKSALMDGFQLVTSDAVYAAETGHGWDAAEGMRAYVKAYKEPIVNTSRGTTQPPPIYTNPLTEDCIVGENARTFSAAMPAGQYKVYMLCGTSYSLRNQYFDFDVRVGGQTTRVRIEGGYQFRNLRFEATTAGEPLKITFEPRSKWVVNAIMIWDEADEERLEGMIAEMEAQVYGLPPEEMAKWKLDPPPPTPPLPEVSAADRTRGFLLYHKPYLECIYPNTNPYPHELNPTLRIFASPGEYEPLTFAVRTLVPLSNMRVAVSDIGPVSGDNVDVRHVRYIKARPNYTTVHIYRIVPDILERFDALDLPPNESHRFWLTVRVPEDAKPGLYAGSVALSIEGKRTQIPVKLRVLAIKLREDPDKTYGIYYRDPIDHFVSAEDDASKAYFWRKSKLEHADMVAHGTRNVVMSAWCRPENEDGEFVADWFALDAKVEMAREHNFKPPFVVSINTGGVYRKYMEESYGSHISRIKMPPPEFFAEMTRMAAFVESERIAHGWPEFLYYPIDEPGRSETAVQFMTRLLAAIQKAGVKTYVTADPVHEAFAPMKPFINVWCCQPFNPDREIILKDMAERDVEYWCYPNHVNGENDHTPVAGARMTYGFGFWRAGFKVLTPWIYQANIGDPFNYLDGSAMDFFNRSEEDGTPIPVAMWEAYREGYDDYRYVYTLESLIKEARAAGKAAAADKAEKELQYVWNAINVQIKYKYDDLWPAEEFDVYRWIIARAILELQATM